MSHFETAVCTAVSNELILSGIIEDTDEGFFRIMNPITISWPSFGIILIQIEFNKSDEVESEKFLDRSNGENLNTSRAVDGQ
jgi:hypothetical protein